MGELLALEDEREVQMRREFGPEWELLASDGVATITAVRAVLSASEDKVACAARLCADLASGFAEAATGESSVCSRVGRRTAWLRASLSASRLPPSSGELLSTVYPFILRGVRLLGVDSTLPWDWEGYPMERERWVEWQRERRIVWDLLAESLSPQALALVTAETIGLEHVISYAPRILKGETAGRVVVDVSGGA